MDGLDRKVGIPLAPLFLIPMAHFFLDMVTSTVPIALPLLKSNLDLSYTQVGLVITVLNLTSSVAQPVFGIMSDRWQSTWMVPFGLVWTALTLGSLGFPTTYPLLLGLVFLGGFGTAAFHPRGLKAVTQAAVGRRGLGVALFMLGGNLGFAAGPIVGVIIFLNLGLRWGLLVLIPAVLMSLGLWRYRSRYEGELTPPGHGIGRGWGDVKLLSIIALSLVMVIRAWGHQGFTTFLPLFLQSKGYGLDRAAQFLFIMLVTLAVGSMAGGYLSDRFGRRKVMAVGLITFSPIMMLYFGAIGSTSGPIILALAGFMLGFPFSATLALAQELMPRREGLASGLALGLTFGVGGVGVWVSGVISDHYGLFTNMVVITLIPLLAVPLLLLIEEPGRRRKTELLSQV